MNGAPGTIAASSLTIVPVASPSPIAAPLVGRRQGDGERLVRLVDEVAVDVERDRLAELVVGEVERSGQHRRDEVGRGCAAGAARQRDRIGDVGGDIAVGPAADGEADRGGAAIAFDHAGVGDREGAGPVDDDGLEALADIDAGGGVVGDQRPGEVGGLVAGAGTADRGAVDAAALEDAGADIGAGHARRRTVGGDEAALIADELDDVAERVDQSDAVGLAGSAAAAILDAVRGIREAERAEAVLLVGDRARQGQRVVADALGRIAVVEDQLPAGEVGARRAGDLDELARVGAAIVVMEFVDPGRHARSPQKSRAEQVRAPRAVPLRHSQKLKNRFGESISCLYLGKGAEG